jgi:hypothetical protein
VRPSSTSPSATPRGVEARHFCRLAAYERAGRLPATLGDAAHDLDPGLRIEPAGRVIVEEEERLGPLHDEVVHAHRDKIDADRLVPAGLDGDLDLRADPVIRRDQNGVRESGGFQVEEAAEPADLGVSAGPTRGADQRLDGIHHGVAGVDIHARLGVGEAVLQPGLRLVAHRSLIGSLGGSKGPGDPTQARTLGTRPPETAELLPE